MLFVVTQMFKTIAKTAISIGGVIGSIGWGLDRQYSPVNLSHKRSFQGPRGSVEHKPRIPSLGFSKHSKNPIVKEPLQFPI